jgi:serine/threonine-protein kinase
VCAVILDQNSPFRVFALGAAAMSPHAHSISADRNLLFGIIALQMDFISRDQLIAAMHAWVLDKHKPLGQILCEQGALSVEDHEAIESLVRRHLLRHDNDPERSLAALSSIGQRLREDLGHISDPEVQASLPCVGAARGDADATLSYVGSPTTPGGRFRILRPHAQGGLGIVSVALDEELHREVALKEIQERYASDEQPRMRFLLEAEITGALEHPGIVPVYGLGHHPDGRPFYAMRFVRGESLKEAVERTHAAVSTNNLELRRLLARFLDVCNAVAYAHSRGVLHRDIKPGNILLGPYGETLVVDWGLAKVVGRDEPGTSDPSAEPTLRPPSASSTGETVPGTAMGTPAYMSPEQAEGRLDLLGPASDVYSLGATLYVVLTGCAPFDGIDAAEVLPKVQRGEFTRPRAVDASIPRPLEAICLKAMALKPADRYATPRALAEDIEHWLADEPVSAHREPWPDRARRWSRKHRTLVTSAAAVLLLGLLGSVGFAAVVTTKNRELARQTQRAETREQMAIDAVKRFRDVVVEEQVLKNNPALEELRKKLLKEPLAFFKSLRAQLQGDRDTRPEALSRLAVAAYELGNLAHEIGDWQDALGSFRESLAIRERLVRENPSVTGFQTDLASSHNNIGLLESETGHPDQALESYGKALTIRERLARENPSVTQSQSHLAQSHNNIGALQRQTAHPDRALESYGRALAIRERLARENPSVTEYQSFLARSHHNIGLLQSDTGHLGEALESYGKALVIFERLARENPSVTEFQNDLAAAHNNIGELQKVTGDPDQALESYGEALAIWERLARENTASTEFQRRLAASHNNIGALQGETGHPDQTLESFGKALAVSERLARENPSVTQFQSDLALYHCNIGILQSHTGHPALALESYREALAIRQRLAGENPTIPEFQTALADSYHNIGQLQRETGNPEQALESYGNALAIQEPLARENPRVTEFQSKLAASHNSIGKLQWETGHSDQALESHAKALAIFERLARGNPSVTAFQNELGATLNNMATMDLGAKRFDQARDKLRRAISWQKKALAANLRHPTYRQSLRNHLTNLIRAAKGLGNDEEAKAAQRELDELVANDPANAALDQRLTAVIRGETPKDNRERLQLADRAYEKKLYAASTHLFDDALQADPKLADDRQAQHRYNAACTAALAAASGTVPPDREETSGRMEKPLTDADRAKFRNQARTWLEAELKAWSGLLESAKGHKQRQAIAGTLVHWREDTDLASVRDKHALESLPEGERAMWKTLWADVDRVLKKALKP